MRKRGVPEFVMIKDICLMLKTMEESVVLPMMKSLNNIRRMRFLQIRPGFENKKFLTPKENPGPREQVQEVRGYEPLTMTYLE